MCMCVRVCVHVRVCVCACVCTKYVCYVCVCAHVQYVTVYVVELVCSLMSKLEGVLRISTNGSLKDYRRKVPRLGIPAYISGRKSVLVILCVWNFVKSFSFSEDWIVGSRLCRICDEVAL